MTKSAATALTVLMLTATAFGQAGLQPVVDRSKITGNATFIRMPAGGPIPVSSAIANAAATPLDLLTQYRNFFGIQDPATQLGMPRAERDLIGWAHTTFAQFHRGVPVFGGLLRTHQNTRGEFIAANGRFFPVLEKVSNIPTITRAGAEGIAASLMNSPTATPQNAELTIVDPGWYGDRPKGPRLAYFVRVDDVANSSAEGFFIDAHTGEVLDRWNLLEFSMNREIHNANGGAALPGPIARTEGSGSNANSEVNHAYDYSGDMYRFYFNAFGRDGVDDAGGKMVLTVNSTAPSCPNAFWSGQQVVLCNGLATDDIVAHELTHGVVQYTAGLIYQNQPGQLNESYADIFGELVDLFNSNGSLLTEVGPPWPVDPSGTGLDAPNLLRDDSCVGGLSLDVQPPATTAGTYIAGGAQFGPAPTQTGLAGRLVLANPPLGCTALNNSGQITGNIAVIDRGTCNFVLKVKNAQNAGAIGVVIVSDRAGGAPGMGGVDPTVIIPTVSLTQFEGQAIEAELTAGHTVDVRMRANGVAGGVRWLVGESGTPNSGFRDMWLPVCKGNPDRAKHPYQTCDANDNGGVHSGSGVPNHAFALMTDGGSFRGFDFEGIGAIKSAAVWYRALTVYLTLASDFEDAYAGLNQAASDLVGTFPLDPRSGFPSSNMFTAHDAAQVDLALQAVEMNTPGLCGAITPVLDSTPPTLCPHRRVIFHDDFEHGTNGWIVGNSNPPTPYNWIQTSGLPAGEAGVAWLIEDRNIGNCSTSSEAGTHFLSSPVIPIPSGGSSPTLTFRHYVATEPTFDGGNLKISVNGGAFTLVPAAAFSFNAYNSSLATVNSDNPLAGQAAFTSIGGTWGTSVIDLTGIAQTGDNVRVRFEFGKDGCGGIDGWYVSDVNVFSCVNAGNGDFDASGRIDLADFAEMQLCFDDSTAGDPPCSTGDLNGDLNVDLSDHALFVEQLIGP